MNISLNRTFNSSSGSFSWSWRPGTSPIKQRQSVTFKVIIPHFLDRDKGQHSNKSSDKEYYNSDKEYYSYPDRRSKDRYHDSNRICSDQTFDLRQKLQERAGLKYKENRPNQTRYHIKETETKETLYYREEPRQGACYNTTSVLDGLKNSSKGRVTYNRSPALSEDEFPPQNQLRSVHPGHPSTLDKVCTTPEQQPSKAKARGRAPVQKAAVVVESSFDDSTFSDQLDNSLSVIESMEFLSDSLSLLKIEKKSKKASIVSLKLN